MIFEYALKCRQLFNLAIKLNNFDNFILQITFLIHTIFLTVHHRTFVLFISIDNFSNNIQLYKWNSR